MSHIPKFRILGCDTLPCCFAGVFSLSLPA
jgi:hypothetical protein